MSCSGLIFVISAPSGAGKSTLCGRLANKNPHLRCSISCTTRPKRPGEKQGRDYFFVSEKKFNEMIQRNELVEWACVHGNYYGTPRFFLEKTIRSGKDMLLNIDVQGGLNIKKLYPSAVMVFVMTPTFKELRLRLERRGKDTDEVIRKRLANARKELQYLPRYDYLVINDVLPEAINKLESIINAEHSRVAS